MFRLRTMVACLIAMASPAISHEFWIQPKAYTLEPGSPLEADIRIGANFVGPDYIFIPNGYDLAVFASASEVQTLEFTGRDKPSFTLLPIGTGLHTIALISNGNMLTHTDVAAFRKFAEEVGRLDETATARADGPIKEAYFRFAKTLVNVGDAAGADRAFGAIYEWVALDDPYGISPGPIRFQLFYNQEPAPDQPVQMFNRDVGSPSEAPPVHLTTDADGVLTLPKDTVGEIMLNSVKLLPADRADLDWVSYWASVTFAR
ncbi:DUF4198 domain-containing protein [Oceaniovalibus sp. ACAM 378]|uniref:DUF4198 domain-containing protein n=1 Tax=Oceaniovalibus sp. ACAM 378 TaxID=2599923 RepID=UPI0011D2F767|nr:DUF4198 domain-containing protein [Oceaniovalibus sp. ACAM 378]TYB83767.1 DUF4198 domain-containing protein [Oceaniovalibus sp. ACAM 378]